MSSQKRRTTAEKTFIIYPQNKGKTIKNISGMFNRCRGTTESVLKRCKDSGSLGSSARGGRSKLTERLRSDEYCRKP